VKIRPETRYGNSRFDLYLEDGERKMFLEVKGVTLEEDGVARFPDAPTERGVKHLEELIACKEAGYEAGILFVIQMKGIRYLEPNDRTHPAFGEALRRAAKAGVQVLAVDCLVKTNSIRADQMIEVRM
jgi:sugar fermentation stimulation protein A